MTLLALVRHGETEWNRQGRVQGLTDVPLNDLGRQQAAAAGRRLAEERWDAVWSSTLSRAAETARIIAGELGIPDVHLDPTLVERNYDRAEGMTKTDIDTLFGGHLEAKETREQTVARVLPALESAAEAYPGGRVLVVSHGGVIGSLVREATGWVWPERGWVIENGSDHRFQVDGGGGLRMVSFSGRPWSDDLLVAG